MAVVDRTTLRTPEGVGYSLPLAGLGTRFIATLIDMLIQVVLILFVFALAGNVDTLTGGIGSAVFTVAVFVIFFGYHFIGESLFRGRTIGKRLNRLRVVNFAGGPVSVRQSAVRNIVRIFDMLPTGYLIGMVLIASTPMSQRAGDIAAGTLVVVEPARRGRFRRRKKSASSTTSTSSASIFPGSSLDAVAGNTLSPDLLDELAGWDVSGITRNDLGIVQQFLNRSASFDPATRARIAEEFAAKLRPRVPGADASIPAERFLELLAEAKQLRR